MESIKKLHVSSYNQQAEARNALTLPEWKKRERQNFYEKLVKGQSLLELGAGPGHDSLFFKDNGIQTMSIDLSPEMIRLCKEKGLDAKVMSFEKLDFPDQSFDAIWALNCLLHVPKNEIRNVLSEIKRVLKPSGLFYMGVYGGQDSEGIWEEDTYEPKRFFSFYKDEQIQTILKEFFEIEYFQVLPVEAFGGNLSFQSIILRN
ncbi:class I SAM-dependent methyltransferase [Ornithinibacillus halophilus]|uniref:Methyltransferase domain-containing protein n=1 Tax=Ornithinibacillus halophilus TaxID=930117 RepID=A0A1M5HQ51_9BACI|nr:class I SAM-dependent methyltransferase [Ornithinibacillus halophilus]SHG18091.1 Methyltransferase domain-containing protein [Ornithinibacillus halophilus]